MTYITFSLPLTTGKSRDAQIIKPHGCDIWWGYPFSTVAALTVCVAMSCVLLLGVYRGAARRLVFSYSFGSVVFFRCLLDPCLFPQFVVQCKLEFTLVLLC